MKHVTVWLFACCVLVMTMVVVGGVTRLSGSGLSIVEWAPLSGAIPPLSHDSWLDALHRYQQSPEGRLVHRGITLEAFRTLFLIEWTHRLVGRLLIATLVIPPVFLWKTLDRRLRIQIASVIGLGALQATVGWWMVKSGLVDEPRVSPYRLATHLLIGFAMFGTLFVALLDRVDTPVPVRPPLAHASRALVALIVVVAGSGALMAGHHAGQMFPTFPDMNGQWLPPLTDRAVLVHFMHRALAVTAALATIVFSAWGLNTRLRGRVHFLLGALLSQLVLGALTVVTGVPLILAAIHQLSGLVLFASAIVVAHAAQPVHRRARFAPMFEDDPRIARDR